MRKTIFVVAAAAIILWPLAPFPAPTASAQGKQVGKERDPYLIDQQLVKGTSVPFMKEQAQEFTRLAKDWKPRLVRVGNDYVAELAFPNTMERNYVAEWVQHQIGATVLRDALQDYEAQLRPRLPKKFNFKGLQAFDDIEADLGRQFSKDKEIFGRNRVPRPQELHDFYTFNMSTFDAGVRDLSAAAKVRFLGYRPRQKDKEKPVMGLNLGLDSMKSVAADTVVITGKVRIVEFVTHLQRKIYEHDKVAQAQWTWVLVTLNAKGQPTAQLVPGGLYYFRLERDPKKCHSILIDNSGTVNLPI